MYFANTWRVSRNWFELIVTREFSDEYSANVTKMSRRRRRRINERESEATWLTCANSNFALACLISRRSEKPAINLRIHYHKLARRSPHVGQLMLTASSSHRTTTRMTDQSGDEEEVRFARLRRQLVVKTSFRSSPPLFFCPSRSSHMYKLAVRFMDPRTGPSIN